MGKFLPNYTLSQPENNNIDSPHHKNFKIHMAFDWIITCFIHSQ